MVKRLTEKDLIQIKKKQHQGKIEKISISNNVANKISLSAEKKKTKPNTGTKVYEIIQANKEAIYKTSVSETHFSLTLDGAKLLSINQIFAILQYKKYEMFAYKKSWHTIIKGILDECAANLKKNNEKLPFFDSSVELTVFRQAPRLVDEDALTTMFKYIIDALKQDKNHNPHGILAEDNPKIVHKIECYSEKGPHCIGIKIKLIENSKKQTYSLEKILEK